MSAETTETIDPEVLKARQERLYKPDWIGRIMVTGWGLIALGGGVAGWFVGNNIEHGYNKAARTEVARLEKCRAFVVGHELPGSPLDMHAPDIPAEAQADCKLTKAIADNKVTDSNRNEAQGKLPKGFTVTDGTTDIVIRMPATSALDSQIHDAQRDADDHNDIPNALGVVIGLAAGFLAPPAGVLVADIIASGGL